MEDRVVIITGAARGIGLGCARRFFEDGFSVVMADRDGVAGQLALREIGADDSPRAVFLQCDVSDKLAVHNLMAETLARFGHVDVLINNAGVALKGGALDLSTEHFDQVMAVNLRGAFILSQAAAKHMVKRLEESDDRTDRYTNQGLCIINMSSINADLALPDYLAYCVSKGGLKQLTKAMALELAPYGIRVNAIAPGSIRTDMLAGVADNAEAQRTLLSRTPLGRAGHVDEVANIAAFLASDQSSYVTGETLVVDGGRMALNYTMPADGPNPAEA